MKRDMLRKLLAVLMFSLLVFMAGCTGKDEKNNKIKVRVAYFPNVTHAQALVLKNQKTLENRWNESCDVIWTSFNAGPAEMEAIFAGEVDIGYIGPVPALNANVKSNGDVKIIANSTNAGAVLLKRKDSGIQSVKNLAGKKVAIPQLGNTQHLCLLNLLSENGLATSDKGGDVTVVASSNADILNLMGNGSIDAALVPEPWGTTIEKNGNAEILLDYDEVFLEGNYPTAVVVVNTDFYEEHPELVREFLEEHEKISAYINENMDEAREIVNIEIKEVTGKAIPVDVIQNAFERMEIQTLINKEAVMKFAKISNQEGFISKVPEENDVFTD